MKKNLFTKVAAGALGVALVACMGVALAGCGSQESGSGEVTTIEEGVITIGTDFDYPPFTYMENGEPAGFEYALMTEIGERLNMQIAYLPPQNFDTLITQVSAGTTMDIAVSGITISDERLDLVDFTDSYYDSNQAIVALTSSGIATRDDLAGKIIGVQSGTSGEDWAAENLPGNEVVPYNAITDALSALRAGLVDALVYDLPVANAHVAGEYTDCVVVEEIATGEQYGIAVNKDNLGLTLLINTVLTEMRADGTMDRLVAEYLA